MESETTTADDGRTFIERARRNQLVASAIEVIAEGGYRHASLARIAQHAGVSKGVVLYHFAGKEDVLATMAATVQDSLIAAVTESLAGLESPRELVAAYIRGMVGHLGRNPQHVRVMTEALIHDHRPGEETAADAARRVGRWRLVADLLAAGQGAGEFRDFDTRAMALLIGGSIDAVVAEWLADRTVDLPAMTDELVTFVQLATDRTAGDSR